MINVFVEMIQYNLLKQVYQCCLSTKVKTGKAGQ